MSTEQTSLSAKKEALSRETEIYKQAIEQQVSVIKQNAGDLTKKVLIVGAGLAAVFLISRTFTKKDHKKLPKNSRKAKLFLASQNPSNQAEFPFVPSNRESESKSPIGDLIKQQIAIFLIGIATQKLQEYLNGPRKTDHEPIRTDDTQYTEPIYIS